MNIKFSTKHIVILKIASFISSMLPFSIYMLIEYYNDYYQFWGIKYLTTSLGSILIFSISILSTIYIYIFYKVIIKNIDYSNENIKINNLKVERANTTNYILANVLPITTLSMDTEMKSVFVIALFIVLGFMYIKNNLYSTNPVYDFLGIKVYTCTVEVMDVDHPSLVLNTYESTVISNKRLYNLKDKSYIAINQGETFFIKRELNN